MGKLAPEERWHRHMEERFTALKISPEFEELASEGRRILGRRCPYSPEEWATNWRERADSSEYLGWHLRCLEVGRRLGLTPWVVEMACLIRDYDPYQFAFVVESDWAKVRVVTEYDDPVFTSYLTHYAAAVGLRVVIRRSSSAEKTLAQPAAWPPVKDVLSPEHRPPRNTAFVIRVETPPLYPIEVGRELQAEALRLGRQLLRQLGYQVPQRIRSSSWVPKAEELRVGKEPPPHGIDEIVVGMYPDDEETDITDKADRKRRSVVTSARERTSKRLRRHSEQ